MENSAASRNRGRCPRPAWQLCFLSPSPSRRQWRRRLLPLAAGGVLLLAAALLPPRAHALDPHRTLTQYARQQWTPENGLPCNNVLAVTQSSDGYLWLGTEEGLVRFDGVRAKVFDQTSHPELGNNSTFVVAEDRLRPGGLIVGNHAGVFSFQGDTARALPTTTGAAAISPPLHQSVRVVSQDESDGTLWVGTLQGLFCVRPDGRVLGPDEAAGRPQARVFALCRDGAGRLCVGTAQGLYRQRERHGNASFEQVSALGQTKINCLARASDGSLWVGTNAGIGRLREDTFLPRPELAGRHVMCLREDHSGMLWVGTRGDGLYRLVADAPGTAAVLTMAQGLLAGEVRGLCEDREGNLWLATTLGLQVLRDVRFTVIGRPEGLADDDVYSIWEDPAGRLWVGGRRGLSSIEPGRDTSGAPAATAGGGWIVNYPVPELATRSETYTVDCVGSDEGFSPPDPGGHGGLLVGTRAGGLLHFRGGALERLRIHDDLDQDTIGALCADKAAGALWVGGHNGIYLLRGKAVLARHTTAGDELPNNYVCALHVDRRGSLWVATDGGLARRDPSGRFTNFARSGGPLAGAADSFYEDPVSGDLFVGTENGLLRLRPQADGEVKVSRYTTREGLFDNKVWSVLADGAGNLWLSSNKGISRLALADLARFDRGELAAVPHVAYGVADGLRSRECNGGFQPAAWCDRAGRLWFATVKGAACVDPARVAPNPLPPPVQVEELLADGRAVALSAAGESRVLELTPGTQKVDFHYTALSLTAPEANRFRYRLEGFDRTWTEAGTERVAHYTNLPPGAYRFRVQAANRDGLWNEAGASLAFRLRPFFYQTWWFRLSALGVALALFWAWQHRRRRRWQARLAQAEADVRARTRTQEVLRQAKEEAEREHVVAEAARVEAEAARAEAERASNAKSEFLSRVSHELRTPLNAILGFGQLLELEELTSAQSQSVEQILGGGRHLLGLVDEVLDLARIERGEVAPRLEDVELGPLLAEALGWIAPLARERGVRPRLEDDGGPAAGTTSSAAVVVRADRRRLKQVLLNLLSNAVKYNRSGGEVVVTVQRAAVPPSDDGSRSSRRGCRLSVRDTGMGIAPADQARLFTPFERLGAAHGPVEGTGLGLAVSRQLIEAMGGSVGVQSTPGEGSTFWVELPLAAAPTTEAGVNHSQSSPATDATAEVSALTLLYVEDNAANRGLVTHLLAAFRPDLRLLLAHDAKEGLAVARRPSGPPDAILLDLNLPGMSGEVALAELRTDPRTAAVPVAILSGDATARTRGRLLAAGARAYLTKPFDVPRFVALIEDLLPAGAEAGKMTTAV